MQNGRKFIQIRICGKYSVPANGACYGVRDFQSTHAIVHLHVFIKCWFYASQLKILG